MYATIICLPLALSKITKNSSGLDRLAPHSFNIQLSYFISSTTSAEFSFVQKQLQPLTTPGQTTQDSQRNQFIIIIIIVHATSRHYWKGQFLRNKNTSLIRTLSGAPTITLMYNYSTKLPLK